MRRRGGEQDWLPSAAAAGSSTAAGKVEPTAERLSPGHGHHIESALIQTRLLPSVLPMWVVVAVEVYFPLSLLRRPTYLKPLFY